jgi:hypothetical protein
VGVVPQASEEPNLPKEPSAKGGPYSSLPKEIKLEDTIAGIESDPVPDPEAGRDAERDFMLRYSG